LFLGPVLVWAHWMAARYASITERVLWLVLAGATAAETVWIATYLAVGETEPQIRLLPLTGFLVTAAAFAFGPAWEWRKST
jgi:hypothetical protein